jgi:UDP:flavonoid glycosyltransferase YjiC (YdhE family)
VSGRRLLFAWELGGGAGHVARFLPTALMLTEREFDVILAVRDLHRSITALGRYRLPLVQAPIWVRTNPALAPAVSYAELLLRFGYCSHSDLKAMVHAWLTLYDIIRPDAVVIDHGPTALIAAMVAGLRRATIGTGFLIPPRTNPIPSFRPWLDVPVARLVRSEREVLEVVNNALRGLGAETELAALADIFEVDDEFLCTVPELDHYPRKEGRYCGVVSDFSSGDEPHWPISGGPKIFVYLPATCPFLKQLLYELAGMRASALLYVPGLGPALAESYAGPSMRFSLKPLRMSQVLQECDLVVCHAGHGTVAAALLAGRPLLVIPDQVEQFLVARNVVRIGAAKMVNPDSRPKLRRLIEGILSDPTFAQTAMRFATKYANSVGMEAHRAIAERCETLLTMR